MLRIEDADLEEVQNTHLIRRDNNIKYAKNIVWIAGISKESYLIGMIINIKVLRIEDVELEESLDANLIQRSDNIKDDMNRISRAERWPETFH